MTYIKQSWENFPSKATPISASRLDHIENGIEAAAATSDSATTSLSSGFPTKKPGERLHAYYFELGVAHNVSASPSGSKPNVLCEVWDQPGVLRHIWMATNNGGAESEGLDNFQEGGSVIRIYIDDSTDPYLEMSLGDFFYYYPMCEPFNNVRVGRTSRAEELEFSTGAYKYMWVPFQRYIRVEVENISPQAEPIFYGAATLSLVDDFEVLGNAQLKAQVASGGDEEWPVRTPITIVDVDGEGQLEAVHVRYQGDSGGDGALVEGNFLIYVDNNPYPSLHTSGGEDMFDGSWGTVPLGGYPTGRAGVTHAASGHSWYRYFDSVPIHFNTHLKVVWWVGQPNQGTTTDTEVDAKGTAYYWLNSAGGWEYTVVDHDSAPLYQPLIPIPGSIPSWTTAVSGTWTVDTSGRFVQDSTDADQVLALNSTGITTDCWIESTVRVTGTTNDEELFLWGCAAASDGYVGQRAAIELKRGVNDTSWFIQARDDFDTIALVVVGDGGDVTGVEFDLALKFEGTKVTAYWKYHNAPIWQSLCSWTSAKGPFRKFGVGTWGGKGTFTPPVIRPLKTEVNPG